jgi:hypothetical protein
MTTEMSRDGVRRVPLGATSMTANAQRTLPPLSVIVAINRHARGDWGEVCEEDRQSNEDALTHGGRLLSVYRTPEGVKFWIITEADRSVTTVLLPEDY